MTFKHKSVLLEETVESLDIKPDGIYVDGALGRGGHTLEMCKRLGEHRKMIGTDQDTDVITAAAERLIGYKDKVIIVRSNYENIRTVLQDLGIREVNGIYLNLGVSSYQLDTAGRGFTYREDTPLDMRMDQRKEETAADVVNTYSEFDLCRIIRNYGEDKFAKNIAKRVVGAREEHPIETTGQLTEIVRAAIPMKAWAMGGHPAKKAFQAIRIELNHELEMLNNSIDTMIELLSPGGKLSIITFHSLEDRIVKTRLRSNENPCTCPPDFPVCVCGKENRGRVVMRKPVVPSGEEIEENKCSKSSKLRVFERIQLRGGPNSYRRRREGGKSMAANQLVTRPSNIRGPSAHGQAHVEGNTARKLTPAGMPVRHTQKRQQQKVDYTVRGNEEKVLQMGPPYLIGLVIAACCIPYLCVDYPHLQSSTAAKINNVERLEQQVESVRSGNNALMIRINTYAGLNYMCKVATEELGMVYASKNQVLLYGKTESEYTRQYEDIPQH